jgi:HK97 family phage portal protein
MRSPLATLARAVRNLGPPPLTATRAGARTGLFAARRGEAPLAMMELVSTVFAVVTRLANSTARSDWTLYRMAASGLDDDRVPVASHAVIDLVTTPNPFQTRFEVMEVGQQHLELAGKACIVVARSGQYGRGTRAGDLPLELWPVRPDRIFPIPDVKEFQVGWMYTSPDGEEIRLGLDEVLCMRTPDPRDPYGSLSPVQSLMTDLESARYSAMWNRNFFINGAQPGGIVTVEQRLSDDEYDEMTMRWREQHQGVANAHRVAILERATYTETKITQRDMQFVELRNVSREMIREAWQMPKFALGDIDDVNRATAEASADWFGRELTSPRLDRWKELLNTRLLPMYGPTTRGLEFDYAPVVSKDQTAENDDLAARVGIAQGLYDLGMEWADALKTAGLPPMPQRIEVTEPAPDTSIDTTPEDPRDSADRALVEALQKMYLAVGPVINSQEARGIANRFGAGLDPALDPSPDPAPAAPVIPVGGQQPPEDPAGTEGGPTDSGGPPPAPQNLPNSTDALALAHRVTELLDLARGRPRNADDPPDDPAAAESVDLQPVQDDWETALDALLAVWAASVVAEWISDLAEQIADVLRSGVLTGLADLRLVTDTAVNRVLNAMHDLAERAARRVVDEAAAQDVEVKAAAPPKEEFRDRATVTVDLLADGLKISAAREASRRAGPDADPDAVAGQVREHLETLTDAEPAKQLGAALTGAQNTGRVETLRKAPSGAIYASEVLDTNTCAPCRAIHGRWICNTDDLAPLYKLYPVGGYVDCLGRERCRGTFVGVWRPKTVGGDGDGQ